MDRPQDMSEPDPGPRNRPAQDPATGRFLPGNTGRPRGVRPAALAALDAIGEEAAGDVLRRVVQDAIAGDMRAAEILLRRVWPERKGREVALDLPPMQQAADLPRALGAVADAVAAGAITPDEGQAVAAVLEAHRRAIDTADLAARVEALEARAAGKET